MCTCGNAACTAQNASRLCSRRCRACPAGGECRIEHMWCDLDLDLAWQPSTGHVSSGSLFVNTLLKLQISFLVGGNFSWDFMISFLAGGIILITKSGDATVCIYDIHIPIGIALFLMLIPRSLSLPAGNRRHRSFPPSSIMLFHKG